MNRLKNDEGQHGNYPQDLEEIISMLTLIQGILLQLKADDENKKIYKIDPVRIRKNNEILKMSLFILEKTMHVAIRE